jgi:hypothetical protein
MRRFIVLVTVAVLMTAMVALPALARPIIKPCRPNDPSCNGTPVPTMICDVVGKGAGIIGWRNGQCWVFHPAPTSL